MHKGCKQEQMKQVSSEGPTQKKQSLNDGPMHKACKENDTTLLCLLTLLGGHWGAVNGDENTVQNIFLARLESGEINLKHCNWFVKRTLVNNHDEFGRSGLHFAARSGYVQSTSVLIDCGANVNARQLEKVPFKCYVLIFQYILTPPPPFMSLCHSLVTHPPRPPFSN